MLAFLPLAGLTLFSPAQKGSPEWLEFVAGGVVFARFLSPLAACLILTYLARQDDQLGQATSPWRLAFACYLPSVALVLAVASFAALASLFLVLPGLSFLLGSSVSLPVLLLERTSVPEAVRRSWERTRYVRDALLGFWTVFWAGVVGLLSLVTLLFTRGQPSELWLQPWAQSSALLPLVVTASALYGGLVCAVYELYRQLDRVDFEHPPLASEES